MKVGEAAWADRVDFVAPGSGTTHLLRPAKLGPVGHYEQCAIRGWDSVFPAATAGKLVAIYDLRLRLPLKA